MQKWRWKWNWWKAKAAGAEPVTQGPTSATLRAVPDASWTGREVVILLTSALAAFASLMAVLWAISVKTQLIPVVWGIAVIAFGSSVVTLLALAFFCCYQNISLTKLGFRRLPRQAWHLVWQIPVIIICSATFAVLFKSLLGLSKGVKESSTETILVDSEIPLLVKFLVFVGTAILMPFAEEIIFRGVLFQYFSKYVNIVGGALISAILFAAMHFNMDISFSAFVAGLGAAWLFYKYQSLWASILLHMVNNSLIALIIIANLR